MELAVSLGERSYPVVVARDARPRLAEHIRALTPSSVVLVADSNTQGIAVSLGAGTPVVFPAGERSKTLSTVESLYRAFHAAGLDRKGLVVAVGGGVVGDVAGFAAATWMRAVRVVHVPTTLLAMVDSAVGGKTGVDFEGKNLVGAFHQPSGVFASLDSLRTLPQREVLCGLGEVLKCAVLGGEELFSRIEGDARKLAACDLETLEPVVHACLALKAGIVSRDEREEGERALLNLGHTLGHALEALSGYSEDLRHGEAVAIGIHFACRVALALGQLPAATVDRIVGAARALGLPTTRRGLDPARALSSMKQDKKAKGGRLVLVLPRAIGRVDIAADVPEDVIRRELEAFSRCA